MTFLPILNALSIQAAALATAMRDPRRLRHFPQKLIQQTHDTIQKAVDDIRALTSQPDKLPTFLVNLSQTRPGSNSRLYEAYVDTVICACLCHYFPTSHEFLVHPQWTYNLAIADPTTIKTLEDLSLYAQPPADSSVGSDGFQEDDQFDDAIPPDFAEAADTSTPPDISTNDSFRWDQVPLGDGVGAEQSLSSKRGTDFHTRVVPSGPGRLTIKRPDFIVSRNHQVLLIVEDKLYSHTAGIAQLAKYMKNFRRDFPNVLGMIGCFGEGGVEVTFYEWVNDIDDEPVQLRSPQGETWFDINHDFVRYTWLSLFDKAMGRT
ncbi:hypothetical protein B0H14DRAFT_3072372 [Mycena olivaceomarginata]|nr:hypothetical protein B0H14DRAFT_3072372 [Mycena olivaceomarginata]